MRSHLHTCDDRADIDGFFRARADCAACSCDSEFLPIKSPRPLLISISNRRTKPALVEPCRQQTSTRCPENPRSSENNEKNFCPPEFQEILVALAVAFRNARPHLRSTVERICPTRKMFSRAASPVEPSPVTEVDDPPGRATPGQICANATL